VKATNSGIPQGTFMRKTVVKNHNDAVISPMDFSLGQKINICGNHIFLHKCDDFTRNFCAVNGNELAADTEPPRSNFEENDKFKKE